MPLKPVSILVTAIPADSVGCFSHSMLFSYTSRDSLETILILILKSFSYMNKDIPELSYKASK